MQVTHISWGGDLPQRQLNISVLASVRAECSKTGWRFHCTIMAATSLDMRVVLWMTPESPKTLRDTGFRVSESETEICMNSERPCFCTMAFGFVRHWTISSL